MCTNWWFNHGANRGDTNQLFKTTTIARCNSVTSAQFPKNIEQYFLIVPFPHSQQQKSWREITVPYKQMDGAGSGEKICFSIGCQ